MENQWSDYFDKCYCSDRLHFQQLEWRRNRLLFWDEQFSFHHNELADCRDGDLYSESHPRSNSFTDANANSNPLGRRFETKDVPAVGELILPLAPIDPMLA